MQYIPYAGFSKKLAKQTRSQSRLSRQQRETRQTRGGNKIPELLEKKRKLDLSIQFECSPPQYLHIKHKEVLDMHYKFLCY